MKVLERTGWLGVLLFFTFLSLVMTYPLVLHMGDQLIGELGDNIYFVWMIGWVKKALFDLGVNPFNVWFLNYPEGWSLAYTEITPIMIFIALPFSILAGPTTGYNAAMLISFILSGFFMYLWVRSLTGRVGAGLVAGMICSFLPYHFAHFLIGHLNLSGIQWFPLYFWGFFGLLGQLKEGSVGRGVSKFAWLGGVSLGLISLTSMYYLYMTLILSAIIGVIYLAWLGRKTVRTLQFWKQFFFLGLAALPLIVLAALPFISLLGQGGMPDRGLEVVSLYSASPTDYILPFTDHFLWGQWIGDHFNREMWVEGSLYIGAVTVVLSLLALIKRRQTSYGWLILLMLFGGVCAFILSLGTDLRWNGELVDVRLPAFLSNLLKRESIHFLPAYYLFKYFPLFAKLRALMRFGVFVLIFSSAAAGIGTAWILEKMKDTRKQFWAVAILLVLVFFDFYNGPYENFSKVVPRQVDAWLAAQPGEGAVIQFPFYQSEDQAQTYYTLTHNKPFVGGFFNAFPPNQYQKIRPLLENFPDEEGVALLHSLGVEYVIMDTKMYKDRTPNLRKVCEELGMRYAVEMDGQMIFLLGGVQ